MRAVMSLLFGTVLLTACATPAQQAASMQQKMDEMIQVYGPACEKLGYTNNTDQWRACILQLSEKDDLARQYYDRDSGPYWRHWRY
jgi:hypothetical protein